MKPLHYTYWIVLSSSLCLFIASFFFEKYVRNLSVSLDEQRMARAKGALLVNLALLFFYARTWESSLAVHVCGVAILTYALLVSDSRWQRRLNLPLRFQASPMLLTLSCLAAVVAHIFVFISFQ